MRIAKNLTRQNEIVDIATRRRRFHWIVSKQSELQFLPVMAAALRAIAHQWAAIRAQQLRALPALPVLVPSFRHQHPILKVG